MAWLTKCLQATPVRHHKGQLTTGSDLAQAWAFAGAAPGEALGFCHAAMPVGNGNKQVHMFSGWGFPGANGKPNSQEAHLNSLFMKYLISRVVAVGDMPVIVALDLNQDPAQLLMIVRIPVARHLCMP